jgi:hypothetical protein
MITIEKLGVMEKRATKYEMRKEKRIQVCMLH